MPHARKFDKDKKYTYADYLEWPEEESWEIIDGVPYSMSPAPLRKHQDIALALALKLGNHLTGKKCKLYIAPFDVRLVSENEDNEETTTNVVQPDLSVICDTSKLDEKGCIGAPDLIIEILSKSTAYKDESEKLKLYEKHRVKEYWIVNPEAEYVMIYYHNGTDYDKPDYFKNNEVIECKLLEGLKIDLKEVFVPE